VTETTNSSIAPRLLIVTDHTELGRAVEQHVSIIWPAAECRIHAPLQSGRLHSGFSAVGYDAVVLDASSAGRARSGSRTCSIAMASRRSCISRVATTRRWRSEQ
jgi:hypothetical protein